MGTVAILEPGYADYAAERAILEPFGHRIVAVPAGEPAHRALPPLDPVAVMVRERTVDAALIGVLPSLRVVARYGVGTDNIDRAAAAARDIAVVNVPDYGAEHEVADHAVGLYVAVARRIVQRDSELRAGAWAVGQAAPVPGHRGATLGLVGFGRIARATARRFRALGFERVLAHDPHLAPAAIIAEGAEPATLAELLAEANAISLHAPLTEETRHLIDAPAIRAMKPMAVLVNVARGGLVDEAALAEALRGGHLLGAGIDVFETEPPAPDTPLLHAPRTVLTDHAGWYSEQSVEILQRRAAEAVARVLAGIDTSKQKDIA